MNAEAFSLDHVDAMIDFLDKHIAVGTDTPAMHDALQERLDALAAAYNEHPRLAEFYSRMLELQSLIHGRRNEDDQALQFMKEAVREAGSVKGLKSKTLQQYIASRTQQQAPAAQASAPASVAGRPIPQVDQAQPQAEWFQAHQTQVQPEQAAPATMDVQQPAVQRKKRRFNPFSRLKVAAAASMLVLGLVGITMYFVPSASAVPIMLTKYSEIKADKKAYQDLTAQYQACSTKLASERSSVDTYDTQAVTTYNQDTVNCQQVLHQQKQAANKYDSLIAAE